MFARNRLAGFKMLTGGEGAAAFSIDEYLDPRAAMRGAKPHVIGRAFVTKGGRDRGVNLEMLPISKGQPQLGQRVRPFMAAVRHGLKVRHGDMALAVCIGRR